MKFIKAAYIKKLGMLSAIFYNSLALTFYF